ncbi:MAG: radical SAM protein [Candidatus Peregrinibacteria bacterium]
MDLFKDNEEPYRFTPEGENFYRQRSCEAQNTILSAILGLLDRDTEGRIKVVSEYVGHGDKRIFLVDNQGKVVFGAGDWEFRSDWSAIEEKRAVRKLYRSKDGEELDKLYIQLQASRLNEVSPNGQGDISNRYQEQRQSGLRYGIIEVTSQCQAKCPGCYMVQREALNQAKMTREQAIRILDMCRDFAGRELETMDILGGEPLLWPELKPYIEELLRRGIKPWIFTNMMAVNPELAKWLFEREVFITGKLNIGNPSDPEQMELQARMIGSTVAQARRMIDAIGIFKAAGYQDPMFRLQNLLRKENIRLVPDFIRYCRGREIGVDLELMGSGEATGERYSKVAPSAVELANLIRELDRQGKEYRQTYATAGDGLYPEFDNPASKLLMPHVFGSCPFYDKGLYFASDGSIRACSNSSQTLALWNKKDVTNPVKVAWESSLLTCRRQLNQTVVGEPCGSCEKWGQCRGGCRATVEGMSDPFGGYTLCPLPLLKEKTDSK